MSDTIHIVLQICYIFRKNKTTPLAINELWDPSSLTF